MCEFRASCALFPVPNEGDSRALRFVPPGNLNGRFGRFLALVAILPMQLLGRLLACLFAPLAAATAALTPSLAAVAHRSPTDGDFALAAIVVSAGTVTLLCSFWAAAEHVRFLHFRQQARGEAARAQSLNLFRETLLQTSGQPIVVMGVDMTAPQSLNGGHELLRACLSGHDAPKLATALDALIETGRGFEMTALASDHRAIGIRGATVGSRVAVFFRDERKVADLEVDGRGVLDALPIPIWVRNKDLALRWVNQAFLAATGTPSFEHALQANIAFDRSERDLATAARDDGERVEAKRYTVVDGARRALSLVLQPLQDAGVAGAAVDVTEVAQAEIKLQTHIDGLNDTLDRFETCVAVFAADQRLVTYNRSFAELWDLPKKWLDANPTFSEIVERAREERRLPEQRDFAAWKRSKLALFDTLDGACEELIHIPDGRSLRIIAEKNFFGGLTLRFKDVTSSLQLESAFNMLLQVQKATLDTLDDGLAVIGPDGRIKTYNAAFARLWHLTDKELSSRPHIRQVAEYCAARIGRDQTWEVVASGVAAAEPERLNDWGKIGRADGRAISLSLSRLPDGGTLATFVDLTEAIRFEAGLREQAA